MTLTNTASDAAAPDAGGALAGRPRASALKPDSALAQLAVELVRTHEPHVAAGSATATCVTCGQPAPCLASIRAREVLRSAGLNDRPSAERHPNQRRPPAASRQHPESGAELR